jgi:hypothetical protein
MPIILVTWEAEIGKDEGSKSPQADNTKPWVQTQPKKKKKIVVPTENFTILIRITWYHKTVSTSSYVVK